MKYNYLMKFLLPLVLILLLVPTPVLYAGDTSVYGEKHPVTSKEQARNELQKFFNDKSENPPDGTIDNVVEHEFFYEAEYFSREDKLIDRVIIDKRTGRIRSIH